MVPPTVIDSADVLDRAFREPGSLTAAERLVFVLIEFETRMEMDGWDDFFTSRWSHYYAELKAGLVAAGDSESLEVLEDYERHLRERNVALEPGAIDTFLVAQNDEYFKRCRDWRDDYRRLSEERWQKIRASLRAQGFELQIQHSGPVVLSIRPLERPMNPHDDIATVRRYYEAYVKADKLLLESLLSADFRFTSPMDNDLDRATYVQVCWPNNRYIHGYDHVHVVAQDGVVFVTYEVRGDGDRRVRNTEVVTVRDGRICRIEVYFGWSIPHPVTRGAHEEQAPARTPHP